MKEITSHLLDTKIDKRVHIQPSSLRMGNIAYTNQEGKMCGSCFRAVYIRNWAKQYVDSLEPIPINEEWLEFLGFKKYDLYEVPSYKKPYCIEIHNGNTISEGELLVIEHGMVQLQQIYEKDITSCVFPVNIKYVHQLQNLFHALTGKELI